jgi:hypothetical protein
VAYRSLKVISGSLNHAGIMYMIIGIGGAEKHEIYSIVTATGL